VRASSSASNGNAPAMIGQGGTGVG
jgi:hypothetical protein